MPRAVADALAAAAAPDEVAFPQFTSGSTMAPRGVMVSLRDIAANCSRITVDFLRPVEITGVSWLPMYHDMGLIGFMPAPLLALRPVVFLDTLAFLKRPALWFNLIHRHRATVTFAPHFAYALAVRRIPAREVAGWDLSCLRVPGCGAEPIAADTLRAFAAHFATTGLRPQALCPSYGLAEATLLATCTPVAEQLRSQVMDAAWLQRRAEAAPPAPGGTTLEIVGCGTVIEGLSLRIIDPHGRALPERQVGEIELRGPSVTRRYFADPDATARVFPCGAARTGDLGYVAGGHLFVTGRQRDLVIVHGRNYAAQTIEWALDGLPLVRQVTRWRLPVRTTRARSRSPSCARQPRATWPACGAPSRRASARSWGWPLARSWSCARARCRRRAAASCSEPGRALFLDGTLHRVARARGPARRARPLLIARLRWQAVLGSVRYRLGTAQCARRRRTTSEPR